MNWHHSTRCIECGFIQPNLEAKNFTKLPEVTEKQEWEIKEESWEGRPTNGTTEHCPGCDNHTRYQTRRVPDGCLAVDHGEVL